MKIRISIPEDGAYLKNFFSQPEVLRYFPMYDNREVEDAIRVWEIFCRKGASLTALFDDEPVGIAYLNLQAYEKWKHQCLITIIVKEGHRGKGIGTTLMKELEVLARETFSLEMLHLEVYKGNRAQNLYDRMGYTVFGVAPRYIKEFDSAFEPYIDKIMMEKWL